MSTDKFLKIYQWSQAETTVPHLEAAGIALLSILEENEEEFDTPMSVFPTTSAEKTWKTWIFRESTRRTFVICFLLITIYHMLKGTTSYCTRQLPHLVWIWTLSGELWKAPTVLDFVVAVNEKSRFTIHDFDMSHVLEAASPTDFDALSKIILVAKCGLNDARAWFHINGSQLD
jgi:hypothetical protein